jgi:hypothetical protein
MDRKGFSLKDGADMSGIRAAEIVKSSAAKRRRNRNRVVDGQDIEVTVRVADPIVAKLILLIAERSNKGAIEYGAKSLLDRVTDPSAMVSEALEESVDQIVYLFGALSLLSKDQNGTSTVKDR